MMNRRTAAVGPLRLGAGSGVDTRFGVGFGAQFGRGVGRGVGLVVGLVVALAILVGCSTAGESIVATGAPEDASIQDFCGAYDAIVGQAADADVYREQARLLASAGTPGDIPMSGRLGYLVYVEHVSIANNDAATDLRAGDLEAATNSFDLPEADRAAFVAFVDYAAGTCFSD